MKRLTIPFFLFALAAYGCSSSSDGGKKDASGGTGGTGGNKDGGTGGSGGAAGTDASGNKDTSTTSPDTSTTSPDTSTTTPDTNKPDTAADICAAYVAGSGMLAGVSAADFCAKFETVCTFSAAGYADKAACMTSYEAANADAKSCRAGHLCNAAMAGGAAAHCPHAAAKAVCQ